MHRHNSQPVARAGRAMVMLLLAGATSPGAVHAEEAHENPALAILKEMSDYVGSQQTIRTSFDSDVEVITPQLEKIQFTNSGEAELSRPDKLRVHRVGGYADVEMVFDGANVTMLDRVGNRYATFDAPTTVDQLIDELQERPGVALPGADLMLTSSYDVLAPDVLEAKHVGLGVIDGVECEHLAFRNFDTDWQLWVRTGDRPIPCKMVITSKTLAGAPQYTIRIKSFESGVDLGADVFAFVPPEGAQQVDAEALAHLDELPHSAAPGETK
jgi:hypothetical protein